MSKEGSQVVKQILNNICGGLTLNSCQIKHLERAVKSNHRFSCHKP
jgi:hypothetical protein